VDGLDEMSTVSGEQMIRRGVAVSVQLKQDPIVVQIAQEDQILSAYLLEFIRRNQRDPDPQAILHLHLKPAGKLFVLCIYRVDDRAFGSAAFSQRCVGIAGLGFL
jgi:hypothetical protein